MAFLRTLFWVVLAVVLVLFGANNWTPVTVRLWDTIVLDTRLPILLLLVFMAGLLPPLILYRTTRWRLNRKLEDARVQSAGPAAHDPVPEPLSPPAATLP